MEAGALRHRVTIQAKPVDAGTDDYGAPLDDWAAVYDGVPASILPLGGRELIAAQQVAAGVSTQIAIRYLPGITAKQRVLHPTTCCGIAADETYDVIFPQDVEQRHRELHLLCSSGLTEG